MGSRSVCFSFTPGENEQLETVITIPEEHRSVIHGIVKNHCGKVVKDAIVKLYECIIHHDEHILKPLTHTFTDECGQFVFGPLWPCRDYVIKVWVNDVKIREIVIHPDDCNCAKDGPIKPLCDKKEENDKAAHIDIPVYDEKADPFKLNSFFDNKDKTVKIQSDDFLVDSHSMDDVSKDVDSFEDFLGTDNLDE